MPAPSFSSPARELLLCPFSGCDSKAQSWIRPTSLRPQPHLLNYATGQGTDTYPFPCLFLFLTRLLLFKPGQEPLLVSSPPSAPVIYPVSINSALEPSRGLRGSGAAARDGDRRLQDPFLRCRSQCAHPASLGSEQFVCRKWT